jgi:UDP-N-acetylmuramoyl-tripeptide--D-alanyl-D-alanine ligase
LREKRTPVLMAEDVLAATGGRLLRGEPAALFHGISTDSRALSPGNLFIPLVGETFDGHDFIGDALKAGVSGILVQEGREDKLGPRPPEAAVLVVADTLRALGDIALFWRQLFPVPVIAVTGSSGKTTTKEMIGRVLSGNRKVLKSEGNFNNLVGLPLTLFRMNGSHEAAILEMGTNRRGEIGRLTEIALPDVGVITNIGPAHLEGFGSLETVREEKGDLFRVMANRGIAVINCDDEHLDVLARRWNGERITFGFDRRSFVRAERVIAKERGRTSFTLKIGELAREVSLATVGGHNVRNALAAAAASWAAGADMEAVGRGLEAFRPVAGRMIIRRLKNGAFLIDDSYNANPASVKEALRTLKELKGAGRGIAVLGDMLELGERAGELHEETGRTVADTGVDALFLKGAFARQVASGAMERGFPAEQIFFSGHPGEIAAHLKTRLGDGDWVLVKGSRRMRMEEVAEAVIGTIGLGEEPGDRGSAAAGD